MTRESAVSALSQSESDGVSRRVGQRIRQARHEHGMSLAQLGGTDLSRGFLSLVESGRSSISLRALAIVASRLKLPISYFVDDAPILPEASLRVSVDHAEAALGYGLYLYSRGKTEEALEYALWAAQANIARERQESQS